MNISKVNFEYYMFELELQVLHHTLYNLLSLSFFFLILKEFIVNFIDAEHL